jgi:hypothetical protein
MADGQVIRTFKGDRESVVEAQAAEDAAQMARDGYVVSSRVWSTGHVGVLEGLFGGGPERMAVTGGNSSSVTVTYDRATWTPDDQPV